MTTLYAEEQSKELTPSPEVAATADVVSTIIALSQGATEMNPLGLVGSTIVKGAYFVFRDDLTKEHRELGNKVLTSAWTGAAVNNLFAAAGVIMPIALPIGVVVGIGIYLYNSAPEEDEVINN